MHRRPGFQPRRPYPASRQDAGLEVSLSSSLVSWADLPPSHVHWSFESHKRNLHLQKMELPALSVRAGAEKKMDD